MSKVIGIDLGTTFSAIAHVNRYGVAELIPNEIGDRTTPSVVFYDEGEFVVGEYARQNAVADPEQVVEFVKRDMGRTITEFWREFNGKQYSAEEISAEILKTLKRDAEDEIGENITTAVITVPAYFNDSERQATIRAGELAGLQVRRIINEPTAAALAYGAHEGRGASTVLVFDLGGGTFDVTVMQVSGRDLNILATNGDHRLGGKDWDDKIILHAAQRFESEHGENPLSDLSAYQDLQARAVQAKIQLSSLNTASITLNHAGKSLRVQIARDEFEALTADLVERCRSLVDVVLREANLTRERIDTVLLVGGSTRLPMIRDMLAEHFGKPPDTSVNPDEAVALGAATMGAIIESEQTGARRLVGSDPGPVAGMMRVSDICSHSLGLVALGERGHLTNSRIIAKNTTIPCEVSRDDYETASANQTEFDVIVLQGDVADPRDCPVRDAYEIYDVPPRPAGETRLKVTFKYNANGVIEVEAEDVLSGRSLPKRKKEGEIDWGSLVGSQPSPMDIALVIDCSGSMEGSCIRDAKRAAMGFLDDIDPSIHHVGLVSFGSNARVEMQLTQDFSRLCAAIQGLRISGSTPMDKGIAVARDALLVGSRRGHVPGVSAGLTRQPIRRQATTEEEYVLVLLTDGYPDNERATSREAKRAKGQGIKLIAVGVGHGVDSEYLKRIASTPDDYYFVEDSIQLESTFTNIATRLVAESARGGGLAKH